MRINVEDELFSDFRFRALCRELQSEWLAIGMLVDFWRSAGKRWNQDASLLSYEQFHLQGFEPLLKVGLAEKRDEGVYAKGLVDHLDWARTLRENARIAGQKSAAARRLQHGTAQPPNARSRKTEQPLDTPQNLTKKGGKSVEKCESENFQSPNGRSGNLERSLNDSERSFEKPSNDSNALTLTLTPTLLISPKEHCADANAEPVQKISRKKKQKKPPSEKGLRTKEIVARYMDLFRERYGTDPDLMPKDIGILGRIGDSRGADRTKELLTAYFASDTQFYKQRGHSLVTFEQNLNPIGIEHDRRNNNSRDKVLDEVSKRLREVDEEIARGYK